MLIYSILLESTMSIRAAEGAVVIRRRDAEAGADADAETQKQAQTQTQRRK